MGKYILKRVLQFIPVFIGVTIILFAMKTIVPGDPISMITGGRSVPEQTRLQLEVENNMIYGDENGRPIYDENGDTIPVPIWEQYIRYMDDLLHGDLGTSYQKKRPVTDIFAEKYPYTVKLAVCAICLEAVMGIGAGLVSAIKRYSFWDILVTLITSVLVAVPAFWLGMILQLTFGIWLKDLTGGAISLPISGAGGPNSQYMDWVHYILPAFTLAAVSTAYTARIMRSQLLDVMNQDYIRTAKAKGLSGRAIILHHALKNALIPVVTYIGIDFGAMMAGAILTETVFNWPGVGSEIYRAISSRDWPLVMGGVTIIIVVVMVINLLVDISYAFLDPRIRLGNSKSED
ncbi:ABC transporter permease [Enorma massiliensis]|uniref:ABC transporter permease n=1 Tax=Enorma massiliensis TaxID=1472761 RepID=A0A1Y3U4Z5_9ACTN|nr:ABC transporter permease [Enorma massiliensis]MBM6784405.1 ABC transporter permease [Enorma massiliensis]MBM6892229.1 ABC transporter permease [Enorma massiliensis]OUN43844.1 ABC transporter permease [Enorma massiliensis]